MIIRRIADFTLTLVGLYLAITFVVSTVLSYTRQKSIDEESLTSYANRFLYESQYSELGKKLDCSGFTRNVYAQFGIKLASSSIDQYNDADKISGKIGKADLVFFTIGSTEINHVGLMLNDSIFIHSPGKGKAVRTDNLNSTYWSKCFYKTGKVTLKRK